MTLKRNIKKAFKSKPVIEGAGVHLKRALGFSEIPMFDPFLLLDDFRSNNPEHYIKGFPWHPHRGIETITYLLKGKVEHGDSLGNKGTISVGDVQWMTAGNGIIHQEMPEGDKNNFMWGFQLWANLPAKDKMITPKYRDVKSSQIPEVSPKNGVKIKIICGEVMGTSGPVHDILIEPEYLDMTISPAQEYIHKTRRGHNLFAYVIGGKGYLCNEKIPFENEDLILFDDGEELIIKTEEENIRLLLISGKPLNEPIAWRGPIVMNSQEELNTAFDEYRNGTFLKHQKED